MLFGWSVVAQRTETVILSLLRGTRNRCEKEGLSRNHSAVSHSRQIFSKRFLNHFLTFIVDTYNLISPHGGPAFDRAWVGNYRFLEDGMNREKIVALCEMYVSQRGGVAIGCAEIGAETPADLMADIVRSYRLAEISESERDSLLAYVCDDDESDA